MNRISLLLLLYTVQIVSQNMPLAYGPTLNIGIKLPKKSFSVAENIVLDITLTNPTEEIQKFIFKGPSGKPWGMSASVINTKTNESVLKYENRAVLWSSAYTKEQLEPYHIYLFAKESLMIEYSLFDIVMTKFENQMLPKGTYKMRVQYYNSISESVVFKVE